MKRDKKGQFEKETEHIETIEDKIKSFSLGSIDSSDYFGISENFSAYLSVSGLGEQKSELLQHISTMQDFKEYLSFLASKNIVAKDGRFTMQCRQYDAFVAVSILDPNNQGAENLELLDIQSDFESLSNTEKLVLIIESLQKIIQAIEGRISYLQSPA